MIGHLAYADGAPCPTLVLDAGPLPAAGGRLRDHLAQLRRRMAAAGAAGILKIALVRPSENPLFDLDYRFFQALPDGPDSFDLRGSCGHSILSAAVAAARMGMLPALTPGRKVRLHVLNDQTVVVCQVAAVDGDDTRFRAYFVPTPPVPVTTLLLTGAPRTTIQIGRQRYEVSLVSAGNPYAFIDGRALGMVRHEQLFAAGDDLFATLVDIRGTVVDHLGWPRAGAFPKIAVLLPAGGRIAVRAISVPSWHPTIALTGAICLASAIRIPHTVPWQLARDRREPDGLVDILTAGGTTAVAAASHDVAGVPAIDWICVDRKRVTFQGSFALEPLDHPRLREILACPAPPPAVSSPAS